MSNSKLMKLGRKNKIKIFALALVIGLNTYLTASKNSLSPWEKWLTVASWIIFAALNIRGIIIYNRDFSLHEDMLTIRPTFLKDQMYDLKNLKGWAEYHYSFFGAFAHRSIVLKVQEQKKFGVSDTNNVIEFEKLSDYLNENFEEINEN